MSTLIDHYRDMARNNAYSNASLLKTCCRLSNDRGLRNGDVRHFDAGA